MYEGSACTNTDRVLCVASNYLFPVFEYSHTGGRCSITGGYVYRGSLNSLPEGLYVYGDFCTGEIFTWNGAAQQVVLDTSLSISSFGEDDAGEIYVVGLNGVVNRIAGTSGGGGGSACAANISPVQLVVDRAGETATISVTAPAACEWTAASTVEWITFQSGATGSGSRTLTIAVAPRSGWLIPRFGVIVVAGRTIVVLQR